MKTFLAYLTAAAFSSVAFGDELTLRNGSTFTGAVREEGDRVTIETEFGFMTFKKVDVRSVVKGRNVVRDFADRSQTASSVKELLDLAAWARERELDSRIEDVYRRVIAKEPDQPEARRALGYERVDGRWLQGDELQIARGFVKVDGRWLSKDAAMKIREQQALARIEAERLEREARVAAPQHGVEPASPQRLLPEEPPCIVEEPPSSASTPSPAAPQECREPALVVAPPQAPPPPPSPPQNLSPVPPAPPSPVRAPRFIGPAEKDGQGRKR
jgi:hypothetical protein